MTRTQRIEEIIKQNLDPIVLEITDESHKHRSSVAIETHIKLLIVSLQFQNLSLMQRHRMINQLLAFEFKSGLHALSMHLFTENEWDTKQKTLDSPDCRGGEE